LLDSLLQEIVPPAMAPPAMELPNGDLKSWYITGLRPGHLERGNTLHQLDFYYGLVKRQILRYQSPTSHLFPVTSNETKEASIRDSIYCAAAVWALNQAYRRLDDDRGKSHELGQSVVACMRGILHSWLRQSRKLELWKSGQSASVALHTIVGLHTARRSYPPPSTTTCSWTVCPCTWCTWSR